MNGAGLRLAAFLLGAAAGGPLCVVIPHALRRLGLEKVNYQGQRIAAGGGLLFLIAALPWPWLFPHRHNTLAVMAALLFGLLGFLDDRWGTAEHKGFRGHLRALRSGRLTTGLVKAVGGLAVAGAVAWALHPSLMALPEALLIALGANLLNLLDLRPLRALKVFWLLGAGLFLPGPLLLAQALGLSLPYARLEARRAVMLGDTGANSLGALLGVAAAIALPPWGDCLAVALLAAFHVWAERHSLSAWIDARPWARTLDGWGWRGQEK
jgi:UDP-N-acetylmuramyl pentapeptide phosphotransferase/UDP-N-acetylglucosamine-1-phosphate transferase